MFDRRVWFLGSVARLFALSQCQLVIFTLICFVRRWLSGVWRMRDSFD